MARTKFALDITEGHVRRRTPFDLTEVRAARRALLEWFRDHARPLPWRRHPRPYAVWISEIMLQQTQVGTVIPYFQRFLRAFPNVRALVRARRERVLELWSGLGYYRRARDLHCAAQIIVRRFGGRFPRSYEAARSLPGVGDYTARSVLSIAYNLPFAVLDGNVARLVARWRLLRGHVQETRFRQSVERILEQWLSRRRPGAFNQALMELGQTVCLPRAPRCPVCPLRFGCGAYAGGRPESYPEPRPRRRTEVRHLAVAAIRSDGKFALVRGLDESLLPDLWNFPSAFGASRKAARRALLDKLSALLFAPATLPAPRAEIRHSITHRSIRAQIYPIQLAAPRRLDGLRWVPARRLGVLARTGSAAVSALARKVAAAL
jgi:A/G-specific adenine glycosylase